MEKEVKQLWDKFRPFIQNMDLDINTKGRVIIIKLAHLEIKREFRGSTESLKCSNKKSRP